MTNVGKIHGGAGWQRTALEGGNAEVREMCVFGGSNKESRWTGQACKLATAALDGRGMALKGASGLTWGQSRAWWACRLAACSASSGISKAAKLSPMQKKQMSIFTRLGPQRQAAASSTKPKASSTDSLSCGERARGHQGAPC